MEELIKENELDSQGMGLTDRKASIALLRVIKAP